MVKDRNRENTLDALQRLASTQDESSDVEHCEAAPPEVENSIVRS